MGTTLHTLAPPVGARRKKIRLGRGIGSGRGKTSTRGMKGQLYHRTSMRASFEGGQLPIHRRVPKRGFVNINRVPAYGLNLGRIEALFEAGAEVTPEILHERGLVPKRAKVIKLLGEGAISKALKVTLHKVSNSAREKIEAAGGTITLIAKAPQDGAEA